MNQGSALANLRRAGTHVFGWRVNQVRNLVLDHQTGDVPTIGS
jgi:hypothetical protein